MIAELERLWAELPFDSQWYCRQRAGRVTARCWRRSCSGGRRPATSSPRWAPRSTSTASWSRPRGSSRGCGCAAGSTGWSATPRAGWSSSTSRPARRPVSKDDAQRHAQLAVYQLAIAEGLLPQGDQAGGGAAGLPRQGRRRPAPCERDQDPMTAEGRDESARVACRDAAAATQGPEFVARINDGCAHCPVRAICPAQAAHRGSIVTARYSPAELADALGIFAPTEEQAAVIAAPPGPLVVIAGAGAGKTETMAARVVWLVANGYAASRRGARADVHPQGGRPAAAPGPDPAGPAGRRRPGARRTGPTVDEHPTVSTYHAFAGTLLREHGLLLPVEPCHPADQRNRAVAVGVSRGVRAPGDAGHREDARRGHRDGAAAGRSARRASRRHRPAARHPPRTRAAGAHPARRAAAARRRAEPVAAEDAGHPDRAHRARAADRRAARAGCAPRT